MGHTNILPTGRAVGVPPCVPMDLFVSPVGGVGHIPVGSMRWLGDRLLFTSNKYDADTGNYLAPRLYQLADVGGQLKGNYTEGVTGTPLYCETLGRYLIVTNTKQVFWFDTCTLGFSEIDVSAHPGWYFLQSGGGESKLWSLTPDKSLWCLDLRTGVWASKGDVAAPNFNPTYSWHPNTLVVDGALCAIYPMVMASATETVAVRVVAGEAKVSLLPKTTAEMFSGGGEIHGEGYVALRASVATIHDTVKLRSAFVESDGSLGAAEALSVRITDVVPAVTSSHEISQIICEPGALYVMMKGRDPGVPADDSVLVALDYSGAVLQAYTGLAKYAGPFVVRGGKAYYGVFGMSIGWAITAPTPFVEITL